MRNDSGYTKAALFLCGLALAWNPVEAMAASPPKDVPIVQWSAPRTWQPDASHATSTAKAPAGRTALVVPTPALPFIAVAPCRLADTRAGSGFTGAWGPPSLVPGAARDFPITGRCGIPATAQAVSFNFAVWTPVTRGDLRVFPAGGVVPTVSTLNWEANILALANAAVAALGPGGAITTLLDGPTAVDIFIDVNGYYAPAGNIAGLNWTSDGAGLTSSPDSVSIGGNLVVGGSITGNPINAKYQDVAEWVPVRGTLRAGTVVVIDEATTNGVVPSRTEYDTRVAGVVTDSPGVILGEGGEGKAKIATTGRVRVHVSAIRPIRVGDLLVTSSTTGAAMKSIPVPVAGVALHRPGTLIGKALEPLEEGEGEILVLLSLQ